MAVNILETQTLMSVGQVALAKQDTDAEHYDVLECSECDNSVRWTAGERLQHLFEHRCDEFKRQGDKKHLAVVSDEATLTFDDLDRWANRLARYLTKQGMGSGDIIGLLFDKSIYSYVSMLAVLKINAAYVPLDPGFPPDRVNYIASDAVVRAILSVAKYRDRIDDTGISVFYLDELSAQIDAEQDTRPGENEVGTPASELCYIIYTSGSTGRPKGVPINHASICNFVRVAAEVYGYRGDDRVYQGLTIAFDFSVEEIWVPLLAGATLVPNQTGSSLLGRDLSSFLVSRGITAMCCVPTLLATIEGDLPNLRLLIVSGEACPQDLVTRGFKSGRTILNAYGPTETTVTATVAELKPDQPVTIGGPLPTYSVVILSPDVNRALINGQVGEIAIAGVGLSDGYLHRDDLTAAVFIDDFLNLPNNPSRRLYRTGDLGRVNDQGQVEYLGRIDTQVKIRGYRIELSEIESLMMQQPQIAQAVVNTYEPELGSTELVAYYTLVNNADGLTPEEIARDLRELLPSYMVPSFYERLDSIPLLPSDKADRKSLPAPCGQRLHLTSSEYVAPEGEFETRVAAILADLLSIDQVSVTDHFFDDLGANSLLMAQFSAGIHEQLEITNISMKEIYGYPSIRQLGTFVQSSVTPSKPLRQEEPIHIASNLSYFSCGALQFLLAFLYIYLHAFVFFEGYQWVLEVGDAWQAYSRAVIFSLGYFALAVSVPVALKWLLIGKWQVEVFPVWSLRYVRFWLVKHLTRLNPMVAFVGTPLYTAYLKALGAKVSWNATIFSPVVPVCTDLIMIGDGATVNRQVIFNAYRAQSNRIRTGHIRVGRDAYVGEASVLDIGTVMETGSQLGHASSVHAGQRLASHQCYHGSPAQETTTSFAQLARGEPSVGRRVVYSLVELGILFLVLSPLPIMLAYYFFGDGAAGTQQTVSSTTAVKESTIGMTPAILGYTWLTYLGILLAGLALIMIVPRLLNKFLTPDKTYKLYGFHYFVYRVLYGISNSEIYNTMFGDSSFIVTYLRALGYRFNGIQQTGSNFGLDQKHDNPFLCAFGKGTMISDGLSMMNLDVSNTAFRLARASIGKQNFLGNNIFYPSQGRTGNNCLLATKVMVPIDGPLRENTGLLGSPCFEIPRTVRRDKRFDIYKTEAVLQERLRRKNVSNLVTLTLYLLSHGVALSLVVMQGYFLFVELERLTPFYISLSVITGLTGLFAYYALVEWTAQGFRRLKPRYCSIYDDYYWRHERHWKLDARTLIRLFNGTPFKTLAWRLLGVRVGKQVFDDGCTISEKTLTAIGDYCTLNETSVLQGHSLEDGVFKSDRITIGEGCTIGSNAFVHYSVEMDRGVCLEAASFLMKGERPTACSVWHGNPAREAQDFV